MYACLALLRVAYHFMIIYLIECSSAPVEEKPDLIKAEHIMQQHQKVIVPALTEEDMQHIHIRRNRLFADSLRAFSRPTFNVSKMLKVTFIGESAVDDGGPRREFFQLLLQEAFSSSGLFVGWPDHVIPLHHIEAVTSLVKWSRHA